MTPLLGERSVLDGLNGSLHNRYDPFFTNTDLPIEQADITHRQHAIIETVFADLIDGPLAHLPEVIFSSVVGRPVDLLGCVVVSVVDVVVNGVR